ncbi:MAG TPA: hypothetical protein VKB47_08815 [Terracidiphilus sp.]|nr:hypothetical protein [Terracidiphilus sp.]
MDTVVNAHPEWGAKKQEQQQQHSIDTPAPAIAKQQQITAGRIAIGVFLGNLLTAVVVGVFWFLTTH